MRRLYSAIAYMVAPLYCGALLWRGVRERGYWRRFGERLGLGATLGSPSLWVHAASLGEVQAAAALVHELQRIIPATPVVLTTSTAAGADRGRALLGARHVDVRYVPLDLPGAVRRFLDRARPRLAIVLETELWPNLYAECGRRGIPLVLASARVSERSTRRYALLGSVFRGALSNCTVLAAQSEADATRFRRLGAAPERTAVVGNIKFDFEVPAQTEEKGRALRAYYAGARPVWVAGSTHEGEERAVLAAHERVRADARTALLVIAPRHPPRFAEVAALLERQGVRFARRSSQESCDSSTEVLLLDTLGELVEFYAAADVVFVGGSLVPVGGHNLLEPAALARAILTGPHQLNAPEIARMLAERKAVAIVHDCAELAARVGELLASPEARTAAGERARAVLDENRGALARLVALIAPLL
ncbi:MAG TPA: lipid IV(A) 3-deoxy-D-manno-octulosonic acid transferase [Steroidobacteraceae bacterium]|nr:lipid IV(A) 3-deoxy-D-manno-octulosonic acid transferase [Steroidobacteraceae bacterium]